MGEVRLTDVRKSFGGTEVIRGVDLHVEDGAFTIFVGPSGCGKSTLLRLVSGLEPVSSGHIEIDGRDVTGVPPARRGLAMVFQSYALYPHMTVAENMGFGLRTKGVPKDERRAAVERAASVLKLTDYLDRRPKALSGGQRQRVAIGRCIVRQPAAFLFDEPLSNLDAALRVEMRVELARLHKELGTTMIYVTHDQVEAMTLADKIVVLRDGAVMQAGAPAELYERPANMFVAQFIGSPKMNVLPAAILPAARPGETPEGAAHVGVRPEHLDLADPDTAPLRGRVGVIEYMGADSYVYAETEAGPVLARVPGRAAAREGEVVGLAPRPGSLHHFDASDRALERPAQQGEPA